jgi:hypothetical protein
MAPDFIGTFPVYFDTNTIAQEVIKLEASAVPNVDWKWRFAALAAGAGPKVDVKVEVKPGQPELRDWFRKTHGEPTIDDAMDLIDRTT